MNQILAVHQISATTLKLKTKGLNFLQFTKGIVSYGDVLMIRVEEGKEDTFTYWVEFKEANTVDLLNSEILAARVENLRTNEEKKKFIADEARQRLLICRAIRIIWRLRICDPHTK